MFNVMSNRTGMFEELGAEARDAQIDGTPVAMRHGFRQIRGPNAGPNMEDLAKNKVKV
jgi:hypothetical protein